MGPFLLKNKLYATNLMETTSNRYNKAQEFVNYYIYVYRNRGIVMELLVKRAQKGDKEAFMKLIDEYMVSMYKVAKTRISSDDVIGDVIQETILSAYISIGKLKQPSYFKTWIMKILMNKCNDVLRDNKIIYVEDYSTMEDNNLEHNLIDEKLNFESILSTLNYDSRTVVVLYYADGFSVKEISEILGEKEGTIKSRLSRARGQLKAYYEKEDLGGRLDG